MNSVFSTTFFLIATLAVLAGGCNDGASALPDASLDATIYTEPDSGPEDNPDTGISAFRPDPQRVYDDLAVLASTEYEGRAPWSEGGVKTTEFVQKRMAELGLTAPYPGPSFMQPFSFARWTQTAPAKLELGADSFAEGKDYTVFSNTSSVSVSAGVIFAGYGMTIPAFDRAKYPDCPMDTSGYDDYSGIDVTGKIVLILRGTHGDSEAIKKGCPANPEAITDTVDTIARFDYKAKNAKLHGAVAVILVQNFNNPPEHPGSAGFLQPDDTLATTLFANRDRIMKYLPSLQLWAQAIDSTLKPGGQDSGASGTVSVQGEMTVVNSNNIIAVVPGAGPTLKDEVIVVGAHMDHLGTGPSGVIYHGADDNASGTATVLELARSVVASGITPARTLVFAAWNAEELGLLGSCYHVDTDPLFASGRVKAAFSVDMVGAGNGSGLYLFGATDPDKSWLADVMAGAAKKDGLEYVVEAADPFDASDQVCFARAGVPAVLAFSLNESDHLYYHTPDDTIETMDMDTLKASLDLMWAALVPLAMGGEDEFKAPVTTLVRKASRASHLSISRKLDRRM
ncbi:MAG: M20/M25/M40 family metallo-hydrolase [Myxococcota bacterium]|jgi:Zn-dependent M28 family amino/carboxypeptidase